ncbi:sensor domain-containing diguanylate cyclase [Thalassobacillus devorans]|uniref:sensor domain-containing diguanylate cyclase n=1 Tax=Thalassobacillus devorans TaxID=279813 RepID=UPI00048BAFCF|nr:sensor domain-containing diguanylate cyclase [Thalassobacillus devorans]
MTKEKGIAIWLTWLFVWPISLYGVYSYMEPAFGGIMVDLFSFAILICIVSLFPLLFKEGPIFLIQGVSLAVFLYFGLFMEIVLTQIGVISLLLKVRIAREDLHRFPMNMLMFLVTSIVGGATYYLLGGEHGTKAYNDLYDIFPILAYAITIFLVNQTLIKVIGVLLQKRTFQLIDRATLWETYTTVLIFPVGFVLYRLYSDLGVVAVYYVGIPFVLISAMLMLYHTSKQINGYLQKTSDIGHELTGRLKSEEVIDLFIFRVADLLPLKYIYIFNVKDDERLSLIRFYDGSGEHSFPEFTLRPGEGVSGYVWKEGKGVRYNNQREWLHLKSGYIPDDGESVLSLPVYRNHEIFSVITVISNHKRAFEKYQYMIVDILTNYLAVAIENANNYEFTKNKSERCPLTNLYNYRYFEEQLEKTFLTNKNFNHPISLILLDIDHFKAVNDTYGHQSGNEILCSVADLLNNVNGKGGLVARYGGEEFVILLPGYPLRKAMNIADKLRESLATTTFYAYDHIVNQNGPVAVSITASIGVANYPDHCEEALELVRHADRAMYVGAKQQGRNKVANYESLLGIAE